MIHAEVTGRGAQDLKNGTAWQKEIVPFLPQSESVGREPKGWGEQGEGEEVVKNGIGRRKRCHLICWQNYD